MRPMEQLASPAPLCLAASSAAAFGAYYAASTKDSNMVPPVPVDCTPAQATEPAPNPSDSLSPDWGHNGLGTLWFVVAWALATLCFQLCCPLEYNPSGWHIPHWLMPWLPSAAICMVAFRCAAWAGLGGAIPPGVPGCAPACGCCAPAAPAVLCAVAMRCGALKCSSAAGKWAAAWHTAP